MKHVFPPDLGFREGSRVSVTFRHRHAGQVTVDRGGKVAHGLMESVENGPPGGTRSWTLCPECLPATRPAVGMLGFGYETHG